MFNDKSCKVHSTAIVHERARIGAGVSIGAYSIIGPDVELGEETQIAAHVMICGHTKIGARNRIFSFASIGSEPQDLKFSGENSRLVVGDDNIIREYVTLQPGTAGGGMVTTIGNKNLFMVSSHVGHDSVIGNNNIIANNVALAGHVEVGHFVTVGGLCGVHQFVRLGDHCFIGGGAMVVQDIPPYCLAEGNRAQLYGLNTIGLRRRGFDSQTLRELKNVYRELLIRRGSRRQKLESLLQREFQTPHALGFLSFIAESQRGVASDRLSEHLNEREVSDVESRNESGAPNMPPGDKPHKV